MKIRFYDPLRPVNMTYIHLCEIVDTDHLRKICLQQLAQGRTKMEFVFFGVDSVGKYSCVITSLDLSGRGSG